MPCGCRIGDDPAQERRTARAFHRLKRARARGEGKGEGEGEASTARQMSDVPADVYVADDDAATIA